MVDLLGLHLSIDDRDSCILHIHQACIYSAIRRIRWLAWLAVGREALEGSVGVDDVHVACNYVDQNGQVHSACPEFPDHYSLSDTTLQVITLASFPPWNPLGGCLAGGVLGEAYPRAPFGDRRHWGARWVGSMACRGLLPATRLGLAPRLAPLCRHRWSAAARDRRPSKSRVPLRCLSHGNHSHSHGDGPSHDSCCSTSSLDIAPPQELASCCGHDHHDPDLANPAHRLLKAVYDATRLTAVAAWLEASMAATVAKVVLFLLAAATAGWAASGWAPSAAAAQAAQGVAATATLGVYLLAGLPAAVDLSYDLTAGHVDTHVLMNLAVLGTLVTGHALEVGNAS